MTERKKSDDDAIVSRFEALAIGAANWRSAADAPKPLFE
jgi:hypothetical protein